MSTLTVPDMDVAVAPRLDHLRALEAESIQILREVVAEFERPVMLYSIGKDSSCMLRLAQKAFYPGPIPFPLLHVDTTYKFREMISFRDEMAKAVGARLIVHTNEEAIGEGTQPFKVGTQRCCGLLKTKALLDALRAFLVPAREGTRVLGARCQRPVGSEAAAPRALEPVERQAAARRKHPRVPALELDRDRRLAVHQHREHPDRSALLRQRTRGHRARRLAHRPGTAVRRDHAR